jgi:hypothetical protein
MMRVIITPGWARRDGIRDDEVYWERNGETGYVDCDGKSLTTDDLSDLLMALGVEVGFRSID